MIRTIALDSQDKKGYAYKLGLFAEFTNPCSLTSGVNVLFGSNGCGKSTLLKMIAGYVTCPYREGENYVGSEHQLVVRGGALKIEVADPMRTYLPGGWYIPDLGTNRRRDPVERNPVSIVDRVAISPVYQPGIAGKIEVEWDGCPAYYRDYTHFKSRDMNDQFTILYTSGGKRPPISPKIFRGQTGQEYKLARSRGESTQSQLQELEQAIKEAPLIDKISADFLNDNVNKEIVRLWKEYILSRGPAAGYVFLLDEPDVHLSLPAQRAVWKQLQEFSMKHNAQIIAASHSPITLFSPELNVIEFKKGSVQESRQALQELVLGKSF